LDRDHARLVFYEQVKRVVPLEAVLARYGVLAELKRSGRQLTGRCPIHRGSNKRQFVVDLSKGVWRCFSPEHDSGGSTLEFVAAMENVDIHEAALRVADWFAIRFAPSRGQRKQRRKTVSGEKPSHKAYVVEERDSEDKNGFWTRVGSAWPHGDGKGLNIQLASGLAVSGRIVLREYTEEDVTEDDKKAATKKKR
jgi:hypothetical protein